MNKLKEKISDVLKISVLALILTVGTGWAFAQWSPPEATPPGGDTAAVLHEGDSDQAKEGGLAISGPFAAYGNAFFGGNIELEGTLTFEVLPDEIPQAELEEITRVNLVNSQGEIMSVPIDFDELEDTGTIKLHPDVLAELNGIGFGR